MSARPGLPPALLRILRRLLPAERAEDVLADLDAAWDARRARHGLARARLWLWREVAALARWRVARTWAGPVGEGAGQDDGGADTQSGRWTMGRDLLQDLRFGVRTLVRRPGFALTAVAVLGLGIGAPATVLTLVSRIFFEQPPGVVEPHRLLRVYRAWAPGQGGGSLMNPDFVHYRENVGALDGLAAWGGPITASWSLDGDDSDQLGLVLASDNYFDVLGVRPARGRSFLPEENARPGTHAVVVLSDAFWRRALGADPEVVGSELSLNGIPFTVVGVAPPGFRGLSPFAGGAPDAWAPIAMSGALTRAADVAWWERLPNARSSWLQVVGRLPAGGTFEAARANLEALSASLEYENRPEGDGLLVSRQALYSPSQATSLASLTRMLLAVVGIVLAIAIANVAVLLLSRATTRARELGVRTAMGAGRGRLARQLLAETLVIAAMGGAVGVGLAYAFSDAAASLLPYAFAGSFAPDARVLGAALGLSLVTALLCGLAPALHAARGGIATALEGARTAGGRSRVRDGLVVGQVLLSLVLVAGAVLFARSFLTAHSQDLGFATDDRLVLEVDLRALGYSEEEGRVFIPRALERLRALPGVTAAASSRQIPFQGDWSTDMDPPPGARANTEDGKVWIGLNAVSDGYFDVMGMSIVRGRALDARDGQGGAPSIVVNETLADLLWPGREALGESLPLRDGVDFAVVGVVRDAVYYELGEEPTTQLYGSVQQVYMSSMSFVIHTAGRATELAAPAQAALREIEPALAFSQVTTLEAIFEEVTARYRVTALLVGLFGALALALAAAGLYGVVSFLVAQRTREIGVRMALGANRARVAGDILRRGMGLTLIGVALGLGATVALRGLTASLLYGIEPADPWAPLLASLVLLGVAALATLAPARRASRIDPMEAIRTE